VNAVDNPARQAFVPEMVGRDAVANAVSLNSVMNNAARAVGPAVAGVLIVTVGVSGCFLLNAASFIAILIALTRMNVAELHPVDPAIHGPGQLLEGLRYVRRTPRLLIPLLMMALIGALSYEFQVVLPLLATRTFHGNAGAYGYLTACFGLGAVAGGIVVAARRPRGLHAVAVAAAAFGIAMLGAAAAPTFPLELLALACTGAASVTFMSRGNTTLQLTADPRMRGRVMALWAVAFIGTTPIGGPIVGYIAQNAGPRWGLALGGFAALTATALAAYPYYRRAIIHPAAAGSDQLPPGAGPI
jgi:MFS family permease